MNPGLNRVTLIGDLSRDPEMRYTPEGTPVASFTVGTSQQWTTADGQVRHAEEWFTVVAWGDLAERASRQLRQGDGVYVEGRLQTRSWEDAAGRRNFMAEVVAAALLPLGRRGGSSTDETESSWDASSPTPNDYEEE